MRETMTICTTCRQPMYRDHSHPHDFRGAAWMNTRQDEPCLACNEPRSAHPVPATHKEPVAQGYQIVRAR